MRPFSESFSASRVADSVEAFFAQIKGTVFSVAAHGCIVLVRQVILYFTSVTSHLPVSFPKLCSFFEVADDKMNKNSIWVK